MKNKKQNEEQKPKNVCNKARCWKIVAVIAIVIFAVFIVSGIMKAQHFKSSFVKPTQEQVDYATKIATEKLKSTGANISDFKVEVLDKMRKPDNRANRTIIQVSFYNNITTHTYIVDVNSGDILLHSQIDMYVMPDDQPKDKLREFRSPFNPTPRNKEFGCTDKESRCNAK